jgi:ATP-dependent RNA helicase TDRD9
LDTYDFVIRFSWGRVYRLVYKHFYEHILKDEHDPEMRRAPLDKVILDTKLVDMGPPKEFLALALDPPDLRHINATILHLKDIGALLPTVMTTDSANGQLEPQYVKDDGDLTVLGQIIASLPVDVRLGKLVVYGHLFNVLEQCIIIAAGLSNKSIFSFPFDEKLKAYANKLMWSDQSFSDCMAVYLAYNTWKNKCRTRSFRGTQEGDWCRSRYLQLKTLREMDLTVAEIKSALERFNIREIVLPNRQDRRLEKDKLLMIKVAIFGSFYPNYFVRSHGNLDQRDVHRQINDKDPMRTLWMTGFPANQAPHGDLYVNQIKDMFKVTTQDNKDIDVEFDNTKVIVHFAKTPQNQRSGAPAGNIGDEDVNAAMSHNNLTPNIIQQVYVGMKLKTNARENLTICLYTDEEAARRWAIHTESLKKLTNASKLGVREVTSADRIGQVDPPDMDSDLVDFDIVHISHPNSFWVTYSDQMHTQMFKDVADAISTWMKYVNSTNAPHVQHVSQVALGHIFLAPFEDEYYRARVDGINGPNGTVFVFFIDYGNSIHELHMEDLVSLNQKGLTQLGNAVMALVNTPGLALECSLAFTKANPIRSEWDYEATEAFRKLIPRHEDHVQRYLYIIWLAFMYCRCISLLLPIANQRA